MALTLVKVKTDTSYIPECGLANLRLFKQHKDVAALKQDLHHAVSPFPCSQLILLNQAYTSFLQIVEGVYKPIAGGLYSARLIDTVKR